MKTRGLTGLSALLLLSSCSLYQKPQIAELQVPDRFTIQLKAAKTAVDPAWWHYFQNQELNHLVDQALAKNPDYLIALKNIQIAQTFVDEAGANLLPQLNLTDTAARTKLSDNAVNTLSGLSTAGAPAIASRRHIPPFNLYQVFLSASYELDIWHQIHNQVKQAKANVLVSKYSAEVIRLGLIAAICNSYFQIASLNSNIANLQTQAKVSRALIQLIESQQRAGLINAVSLENQKILYEAIRARLALQQKQRAILVDALALMVGEYPEQRTVALMRPLSLPAFDKILPKALPSQMLLQRPDIRQALYQVVAYGYLEKQNLANFLPNFNLTANYGYASSLLKNFISNPSILWNYGYTLLQPIFDYGLRMAQYKQSQFQFQAAYLNYQKTVINAFVEVDQSLAAYQEDRRILASYQQRTVNYQRLVSLSQAEYQSGLSDKSSNLNQQLLLLQNQFDTNNQSLLLLQDLIQLYKNLGLGLCREISIKSR